jgi:iron complex transport system substrate-binding protein
MADIVDSYWDTKSRNMVELVDDSDCGTLPPRPLRIVSLIPSATDICVHLGLGDFVVGITHCCDTIDLPSSVVVVTGDKIHAVSNSQRDIHAKVVENGKRAEEAVGNEACLRNTDEIPTLYPIDKEALKTISPTLIITQDLCHVCAPSSQTVFRVLKEAGIDAKVVLLTPTNLNDVVTNLQEVADAAGISARGRILCEELTSNLNCLETIVREKRKVGSVPKKVLVMEWVDPPFCGGHWIRKL